MGDACDPFASLFCEVIEPHLSTEEGEEFMAGSTRFDKIRTTLAQHSPSTAEQIDKLILGFMWEQISTFTMQEELRIEPFLRAEITSEEQQSVAKSLLCDAFGLVTQKGDANSQARLEEGVKFQMDVEDRFREQPGRFEDFLRLQLGVGFQGQPKEEALKALLEILAPEEDLIRRFETLYVNLKD
ncbi:MAG: hypothetical protein LQ352_003685 [Teloschistes flavicans]|nr:MAG: hypothetical protein LQ352_003685 [Teloschistes flavicans]